jgi:hypothetical protein
VTGNTGMPYYRLFFLDHTDHVVRAEVVAGKNDADIVAVVRKLIASRPGINYPAVDVWQSDRRLGRLKVPSLMETAPDVPTGAAPRATGQRAILAAE